MDEELNEDKLYDDDGSANYYLYALVATAVLGLPLLFAALFKIYADHQRHQSEQQTHEEKMWEYRDAKKGLAASLRCEVSTTRARYERERVEKEAREREARLDHGKLVRELESTIRSLKRQLTDRDADLRKTVAEAKETQRATTAEHSREMRLARDTIARLDTKCENLRKEMAIKENEERENYGKLERRYRRERAERDEKERGLTRYIEGVEDEKLALQVQLKTELARAEELVKEVQRVKEAQLRTKATTHRRPWFLKSSDGHSSQCGSSQLGNTHRHPDDSSEI